ncbi:MAG: bifunctional nuclease family protein [Paludibacter sp.]|nr:bifunctional nuclease family protein [Paludibacter sp.]
MIDDEIKIRVIGLVNNQTTPGTYGLVMGEEDGNRRFSILIGESEALSIAWKINNKVPPRPLTHDLINNLLITFGASLQKVVIFDMVNEVFFSEMHIQKSDGNIIIVDARTSDAVALAVRTESPIYIMQEILNIVGIVVTKDSESQQTPRRNFPDNLSEIQEDDLKLLTSMELQLLLERALKDELYELAILIRNEINSRN